MSPEYEEIREESYLPCVQQRIINERTSKRDIISKDDILNLVIDLNTLSDISKLFTSSKRRYHAV